MIRKEINVDEFIIQFEYFGLSNSARVKKREWELEPYFKCFVPASGQEIDIKQIEDGGTIYWIDIATGSETAVSQILGQAIENKLLSHI